MLQLNIGIMIRTNDKINILLELYKQLGSEMGHHGCDICELGKIWWVMMGGVNFETLPLNCQWRL